MTTLFDTYRCEREKFTDRLREKFLTHTRNMTTAECVAAWKSYVMAAEETVEIYADMLLEVMKNGGEE